MSSNGQCVVRLETKMALLTLISWLHRVIYLIPYMIYQRKSQISALREVSVLCILIHISYELCYAVQSLIYLFNIGEGVAKIYMNAFQPIVRINIATFVITTLIMACELSLRLYKIDYFFEDLKNSPQYRIRGADSCTRKDQLLMAFFFIWKALWTVQVFMISFTMYGKVSVAEFLNLYIVNPILIQLIVVVGDVIPIMAFAWKRLASNVIKTKIEERCRNIRHHHRQGTGHDLHSVHSTDQSQDMDNSALETVLDVSKRISKFDKISELSLLVIMTKSAGNFLASTFLAIGLNETDQSMTTLSFIDSVYFLLMVFNIPGRLQTEVSFTNEISW